MTYQEALEVIRNHATLGMLQEYTKVRGARFVGCDGKFSDGVIGRIGKNHDTIMGHIDFAEHVLELLDKKDKNNS